VARKKPDAKLTSLRIPEDLLKWVKDYAEKKNTTVTRLVVDHLTELRTRSEEGHVEQI
jgi:hypothetical protein